MKVVVKPVFTSLQIACLATHTADKYAAIQARSQEVVEMSFPPKNLTGEVALQTQLPSA